MSRTSTNSGANRVPNPVRYFVSFSGATGTFSYWDREAKEKVDLGESVDMVLMDTRSAVTGWNEEHGGRIFSNRVKSITEEFTVRCGKETLNVGLWSAIKDEVKSNGGKFCTEAFCLMNIEGVWEPVQLDFSGASLGDWMTFVESVGGKWNLYQNVISITKGEQKKKGAVKFFGLTFKQGELPTELSDEANTFNDDMLQPYLKGKTAEPVAV